MTREFLLKGLRSMEKRHTEIAQRHMLKADRLRIAAEEIERLVHEDDWNHNERRPPLPEAPDDYGFEQPIAG